MEIQRRIYVSTNSGYEQENVCCLAIDFHQAALFKRKILDLKVGHWQRRNPFFGKMDPQRIWVFGRILVYNYYYVMKIDKYLLNESAFHELR